MIAATRVAIELAGRSHAARFAIAGAAAEVQLAIVYESLPALAIAHADFVARWNALESAPAGSLAKLAPYRRYRAGTYTAGEDFLTSDVRDRVATRWFGLRGAVIDPPVYGADRALALELQLVADAAAPAVLPRWYSARPHDRATPARRGDRACRSSRSPALAVSLRAVGLAIPGRDAPIEVAWLDGDRVARGHDRGTPSTDWLGRFRLYVESPAREVWALSSAAVAR